uniref:Secreted protein n=1 Tax=Arion vulgaris TaxID=1028688 RepID=A0A0B6Z9K0_9EUPU
MLPYAVVIVSVCGLASGGEITHSPRAPGSNIVAGSLVDCSPGFLQTVKLDLTVQKGNDRLCGTSTR